MIHAETKTGSLAESGRAHRHLPTSWLHNLFHNGKSKSDSCAVYRCSSFQFAKLFEQLWNFIFTQPHTSVSNFDTQQGLFLFVVDFDYNVALLSEFDRVFDQIHDYLFKSACISKQDWKIRPLTSISLKRSFDCQIFSFNLGPEYAAYTFYDIGNVHGLLL